MNSNDVEELIKGGEGQRTEFKVSFSEAREAIESLCGFAHVDGGTVLFGVRDDGQIVGCQVGKKTLEDFANRIRFNTLPPLTPRLYQVEVGGKIVAAAIVERAVANSVHLAYNIAFVRVGKTNQVMPPDQQKARYLTGFTPDARSGSPTVQQMDESWEEREQRRVRAYQRNRGLFLAHAWQPSTDPGQVADVVIYLRQHGDPESDDCPLSLGLVKSVEYHLGPRFSRQTIVKTNSDDSFRFEVSAYGPMLCLARVSFDDGKAPVDLERYIDF